jgi:tetratricopeptide (TPR) repeat protein
MENHFPYESNRCSMHHERPAEGRCHGCGEFFCSECLDSHGNCPACSDAAERFLEGFSTALSRWETGLRHPGLNVESSPPGSRKKKFSLAGLGFLVLAGLIGYMVYFLSDYNLNIAGLYLEQGNIPKAREHLEKALSHEPGNAALHNAVAELCYEYGDVDCAVKHWKSCIELDSTATPAMNNLAWAYTQLNTELEEALELSRRAVDREPDNPVYLDTLAEVYYLRKEYYRALTFLRKAVEQEPPDLEYYLQRLEKIKKLAYSDGRILEV